MRCVRHKTLHNNSLRRRTVLHHSVLGVLLFCLSCAQRNCKSSPQPFRLKRLRTITGKAVLGLFLFRAFRPALALLYSEQGMLPDKWTLLRSNLSPDLRVTRDTGLGAASCPPDGSLVSIFSIRNSEVKCLADIPAQFPGESRVWISVRMPPNLIENSRRSPLQS